LSCAALSFILKASTSDIHRDLKVEEDMEKEQIDKICC